MNFIVDKDNVSKRLDIYLSENIEDVTRSYIKTLIDDNKVLVNNKSQKSGYKIKLNDSIDVTFEEKKNEDIVAQDIPLEILYEDDDIIIVNKPKGMVVHPANGNYTGTMVNSLMLFSSRKALINKWSYKTWYSS